MLGFACLGTLTLCWGSGFWFQSEDNDTGPPIVPAPPPTTFGSAQWGTPEYMRHHGLIGGDGLILGVIPGDGEPDRLRYSGDGPLLTFAPTGSGKGTTAIIPNLFTHTASCLVVDPKGENALITADARRAMGHTVHVVDPWGEATEAGRCSRFNPMDWLRPDDPDISENAMILADALVMKDPNANAFWGEESKSMLHGHILHVATDPEEAGQRHLGRVYDLLKLDTDKMTTLFLRMTRSVHYAVASAGARSLQKTPETFANVLTSAQTHLRFLESDRVRDSLSASDFDFADLKTTAMTVYLVLPSDRLGPFGRWLRLLIQQAITVNARNIAVQPDKPILFLLDEMAALGKLEMVHQAFGLMRGYGMQFWGILQNAGQLKEHYGDNWEGFISNAATIMYHGSLDNFTTDYFSKQCGVATVLNFSASESHSSGTSHSTSYGQHSSSSSGSSHTSSVTINRAHVQRQLALPDELMRLGTDQQLVLIARHRPMLVGRLPWFEDDATMRIGRNLRLTATPINSLRPTLTRTERARARLLARMS